MSRFVIVRHQALHTGGTKFYQQVKIEDTKGGKAFLVQHWGRWTGDWNLSGGQTKVLKSTDPFAADQEYRKKWHEKSQGKPGKGHYEQRDLKTYRPNDLAGLREILTLELGANNMQVRTILEHFGDLKWEPTPGESMRLGELSVVTAGFRKGGDVPTTEGWGSW